MKLTPTAADFWMLPLGGCGVFGANMTLYGHDGWWIAVDCGTSFADERHPGIDMMLPDVAFIEERKKKLAAIIITHAHEDHIGGLPYIWPQLQCPVYATPFALEVIKRKCAEVEDARGIILKPLPTGSALKFQGFEVTALPLCHSIVEPRALHIKTPAGAILHTGDWNNDQSPVIGHKTEKSTFSNLGPLLSVVGDSTNAMVEGKSGTEASIEPAFEQIFSSAKGKVAVTMFSSNIGRLLSIAKAARKAGRHMVLAGRSLRSMAEAARTCGYLDDCPPLMTDKEAGEMRSDKVVYLVAGSQGEPRSALAKIARDDHPFIQLGQNDLVCFSARAIPGNEKKINEVINGLVAGGVKIMTANDGPIHVSGHAYADDIRQFLKWTKPQSVMAVHGELMMQDAHVSVAREAGVPHAFPPQNGEIWNLVGEKPRIVATVEAGYQYIEQSRLLAPDHRALSERRKMSFNGAVLVTLHGKSVTITPLGLVDDEDEMDMALMEELHGQLREVLRTEHKGSRHKMPEIIRTHVRRFFDVELGYKPITVVHTID